MGVFMIVGAGIVGLGLIFLIVAIIVLVKGSGKKYSAQTTGMVIDMCQSAKSYNSGGDGSGLHAGVYVTTGSSQRMHINRCPIFTYNVNGFQYNRADQVSINESTIRRMLQQPITVYYDPYNPADARLSKKNGMGLIGGIFIIVGLVMIGMGVMFVSLG